MQKTNRAARLLLFPLLAGLAACGAEGGADDDVQEPTPLAAAAVQYPVDLWDEVVEGEVVVLVHVTPTGGVDSAYIHTSSGHAAFDSAALAGARETRFHPARRGDKRIPMWAKLPVRFVRDTLKASN
jgi:TonB family protein